MKKIVNGRKYDTDTAQLICTVPWREFIPYSLYRKTTGEFFMVEDETRVKPMTEEERFRWAEEHMDGDDYEAVFGPVPE